MSETGLQVPQWVKKEIRPEDNYGKFVIEPLERGYGMTIGNPMRRVLLSALEGAAIVAVRIKGVRHEFSTIKGVREDGAQIVLNLKMVLLKKESGSIGSSTQISPIFRPSGVIRPRGTHSTFRPSPN